VLEVREYVDFSTGNIDFDGCVKINLGVRDRFVVKATEDVIVNGPIEAATIICGRNLSACRGMAAKDRGRVVVEGDADVGYFDNVRGRIRGCLTVRRELMECDLIIGGELNAEQSSIIGGSVVVTGSAKVGTIGSSAGVPTTLVLGTVPLVAMQLRRLDAIERRFRRQLKSRGQKLSALRMADGERLDKCDEKAVEGLINETKSILTRLDACAAKHAELSRRIDEQRTVDLRVLKGIHPRVRLRVGSRDVVFGQLVRGPVSILEDCNGDLHYRQGDAEPRPISEVVDPNSLAA
jgi:uncharacterized protein (DUF342 family)